MIIWQRIRIQGKLKRHMRPKSSWRRAMEKPILWIALRKSRVLSRSHWLKTLNFQLSSLLMVMKRAIQRKNSINKLGSWKSSSIKSKLKWAFRHVYFVLDFQSNTMLNFLILLRRQDHSLVILYTLTIKQMIMQAKCQMHLINRFSWLLIDRISKSFSCQTKRGSCKCSNVNTNWLEPSLQTEKKSCRGSKVANTTTNKR